MYLQDQSQKINHFKNNVLCLDFIDPLAKHCLFHQSLTKVVHTLEITPVAETMQHGSERCRLFTNLAD